MRSFQANNNIIMKETKCFVDGTEYNIYMGNIGDLIRHIAHTFPSISFGLSSFCYNFFSFSFLNFFCLFVFLVIINMIFDIVRFHFIRCENVNIYDDSLEVSLLIDQIFNGSWGGNFWFLRGHLPKYVFDLSIEIAQMPL